MCPDSTPPPQGPLEPPFEALVRAHYPRLFGVAFTYLHATDAAEDAVQEALFKVWRQRVSLDLADPLPYLFRAIRNQCITMLRRRRRWVEVTLDTAPPPAEVAPPINEIEAEELETAVRRTIAALPERCRLVFLLSREQHLSYAEIARTLGLSVKTVEAQMGKALRLLRRHLAQFLTLALSTLSGSDFLGR